MYWQSPVASQFRGYLSRSKVVSFVTMHLISESNIFLHKMRGLCIQSFNDEVRCAMHSSVGLGEIFKVKIETRTIGIECKN